MLTVNSKAPDFALEDKDGKIHTFADFPGKWKVIYFYPKDDTPGCTKEACGFRDNFENFKGKGIEVIGISKDTPTSHAKFIQKYNLNFILLADPDKKTIKAYGAWGKKKFMGREFDGIFRVTYLIDPEGMIRKVYEKVKPEIHAAEILKDWQDLSHLSS